MSGFKALKDVSYNFEEDLRRVSAELFSAKIGETFESKVSKKLRDLSLFTSKMRLLRAKPISLTPQIASSEKEEDVILSEYGELAMWRVVEQQICKAVAQSDAVKSIVTSPQKDPMLDPERIKRCLTEYRNQESVLHHLDTVLREKENELAELRVRWDMAVGVLRDMGVGSSAAEVDSAGPFYMKLRLLVNKMEMMRWLISLLASPRTHGYDWLRDPHSRVQALKLTRTPNTVHAFVFDHSHKDKFS